VVKRRCEFCGSPEGEARPLTVTPAIEICGECIVLCQAILVDRSAHQMFVKEIDKLAALSAQDEADLAMHIERGDLHAMQKMVESNLRLVVSVAEQYRNQKLPFLDICQEGALGLLRAAENSDYRYGVRFSTYARSWGERSIEHAIARRQAS